MRMCSVRTESGNYSGIGDILLRTKLNLGQSPRGAGAVALDLRLPTGDEENLAGSGKLRSSCSVSELSTSAPFRRM